MKKSRIYLVGMPGSGKTTLGQQLAQQLGYRFVDLDALLVQAQGRSIPEIFAQEGEDYFRHLEQQTLQQTQAMKNTVIATGGGTPCFFANMAFIRQQGLSVFINVPLSLLISRILEQKGTRPLFAAQDQAQLLEELSAKWEQRQHFYRQADLCIGPEEATAEILSQKLLLFN